MPKRLSFFVVLCCFYLIPSAVLAWTPLTVKDDPLVRMPGTQPEQNVVLEAPNRCLNCHEGYNQAVEPGFNWKGSMMAQAARDPIFWACMAVSAQDSVWAIGTPNAVDLCQRCHFPQGWLEGRSDPPNVTAMTGSDYDGLACDFCHTMWNPFFEETHTGSREGSDWAGYWDEASALSQSEAFITYDEDMNLATAITTFSGDNFFANNFPKYISYGESTSGQFFNSPNGAKRAGFADHEARHQVFYSRYHKSKYMCGTCHDVSNPVLANLGLSGLPDQSGGADQITEQYSAANYFHVERTFSEFMLSAFGQQGGAATNADFRAQGAPEIFWATKCQDCHMRDVIGAGADKNGVPIRATDSMEHPASGMPLHDLTGGNAWISHILASLDPNGPVYDAVNAQILNQGPEVLTLDLTAGQVPSQNGAELKAGSDRAKQQLLLAGTIKDLAQVPDTSEIKFKIQNNTGHKLISGFPEGRRMFVNIKAYAGETLIHEINPYDDTAGTLKGLPNAASSPQLSGHEAYVDELVYEVHPKSDLTGEDHTFHFVLATGRYKDIRIPPRGFDIAGAADRNCEPVWHGEVVPDYFSAAEYAGGYDEVSITLPPETDFVDVRLFYQGTSREYIEFLRDEINGTASSLTSPTPSGEPQAYILQSDPFFSKLKAWGNVIWDLWEHNHGLDGSGVKIAGIVPFEMTRATLGVVPPPQCPTPAIPAQVLALGGSKSVTLTWQPVAGLSGGYRIHYDQAGKRQYIASVDSSATQYLDSDLAKGTEYCYVVTAWEDCDGNGVFDEWVDMESAAGMPVCTHTANEPPVFFWPTLTEDIDVDGSEVPMENGMVFNTTRQAITWTTRDPDAPKDDLGWASRLGIAHSYVSYREVGDTTWPNEEETVKFRGLGFYGRWSWVYPARHITANGNYEIKLISEDSDGARCEEVYTISIALP